MEEIENKTVKQLRERAKELKIKGYSTMRKSELTKAIEQGTNEIPDIVYERLNHLNQLNKEKIECACGKTCQKGNKTNHVRSTYHRNYEMRKKILERLRRLKEEKGFLTPDDIEESHQAFDLFL